MLYAERFFSLAEFKHKKIFVNTPVLTVLQTLSEYIQAQHFEKTGLNQYNQAYIEYPEKVFIGRGTTIEPGAYIRGPCIIGENCQIRHGAYIRGTVLIGNNCVIGHATEIKHSILLNNVKASHFAFIGDSILGNNVNLGAGVKCANLRVDGATVSLYCDGSKFSTGLRKFGSLIGDFSQIGCNTVLNPGAVLGQRVLCSSNSSIQGFVCDDMFVRTKNEMVTEKR